MARRKSSGQGNSVSPPKSSQNREKEFENESSVRRQSRRLAVFVTCVFIHDWKSNTKLSNELTLT